MKLQPDKMMNILMLMLFEDDESTEEATISITLESRELEVIGVALMQYALNPDISDRMSDIIDSIRHKIDTQTYEELGIPPDKRHPTKRSRERKR